MNIVLLEPEIPHNTGAIGRTCVITGSRLHLIKPLGFSVDEKALRRSGLDYWKDLDVHYYDSFTDFLQKNAGAPLYLATTKARYVYTDVSYHPDSYIVFGKESAGIPEEILLQYPEQCIRIPMAEGQRSLNLSNAAAIVLYEALRQNQFKGLTREGQLHRHKW